MKYFTISELTASSTAKAHRIDNTPPKAARAHLQELTEDLLDPLREKWTQHCQAHGWEKPGLVVTSGYRCRLLNVAVGGVTNSAHLQGYAADIQPANGKQSEFEAFVSGTFAKSGIKYDQIIIEKSRHARWVHFGLKKHDGSQRNACFRLNVSK